MASLLNIMLVIFGSCMVVARPATPSICTRLCALPPCTNPIKHPGICCPICPIGDCSKKACAKVYCDGQFTPLGQCCPVCPNYM